MTQHRLRFATARRSPGSRRPYLHTLIALILAFLPVQSTALAQQADEETVACSVTQNGYMVEVCLEAPSQDQILKEDVVISATVAVEDTSVKVRAVVFELDGNRVLTDADAPYTFVLPVSYFEGGRSRLSAYARLSDDTETNVAHREITLGVTDPMTFNERTFEPPTGRPAEDGEAFVVAAIGDSAGGSPQSMAVADLIDSWDPNLLLYLGDVYNSGTYTEFLNWYDPEESLGRFRDITLPTAGNHEYAGRDTPRGYMEYWGTPPHFYSVDTAGWHIVSLDSNPRYDQTHPGSDQLQWLDADLASSPSDCTVVFFHHPPFSVGAYEDEHATVEHVWDLLVEHDVTLVLSGHDHNYQRWQGLDEDGVIDPDGPVSLVVGTGGHSVYQPKFEDARLASPALTAPGALRMELNPNGATLQFITTDGVVRDQSSVTCAAGASQTDTVAPSSPTGLTATHEQDGSVSLRWEPSRDDTGVTHYEVYRNQTLIADSVNGTAYIDRTFPATEGVAWSVVAVDAAGNRSPFSESVGVDARQVIDAVFADNFSTGTLDRWEEVNGLTISPAPENTPGSSWIALARGSTDPAYALLALPDDIGPSTAKDVEVVLRFRVTEQGENPVVFLRFRNPERQTIMSVNMGPNQHVGIFNDVTASGTPSAFPVPANTWQELTVRLAGPPGDRIITVSLDGVTVREISGPIDLGNDPIAYLQLGDSTAGRIYTVQYSEVVVRVIPNSTTPVPQATPVALRPGRFPSVSNGDAGQTLFFATMIHSHNALATPGPLTMLQTSHGAPRAMARHWRHKRWMRRPPPAHL